MGMGDDDRPAGWAPLEPSDEPSPSERRSFRLLAPGIVATVVALGVGSVGFDVYVSHIASYNTTYGAFAGAVILLLWIWLAAIALLLGSELDAVIDER